jgi:hypothetical protein
MAAIQVAFLSGDKGPNQNRCFYSGDVSKATLDYYTSALIHMIGTRQAASNLPPSQF